MVGLGPALGFVAAGVLVVALVAEGGVGAVFTPDAGAW